MLDGNKYNNNLQAITEFKKIIGKSKNSKVVKTIRILFKDFSNLNFEIFIRNIIEGIKLINQIQYAPFAGVINLSPPGIISL